MYRVLKSHLLDNSGEENITKVIWISIAFIVGAIIIAFVYFAWKDVIAEWLGSGLNSIPNLS